MQRFAVIVFLVLSVSNSGITQQTVTATPGSGSGALPDAPRRELANLFLQRSETNIPAVVALDLQDADRTRSLQGTRITLSLLSTVSSKSPSGSAFRAQIDEPVVIQGRVAVPAGTIFEGHLHTTAARRIMRPGSLFMTFERMVLPNGDTQAIDLHVVDAAIPGLKSDAEGRLHPALSKKRLAIQLGGTALTAKFADDLAELAGGTAVGAGSARFIGAGAATTFFLLQKGREVKLNAGDKLDVEFGRTVISSTGTSRP